MDSKINSAVKPAQRLGSFTRKYSGLRYTDHSTGESIALELGAGGTLAPQKQANAARVLSLSLKRTVSEIIPDSRTAKTCMSCQAPDFQSRSEGKKDANFAIEIRKNKETGVAHFSGLMMCGSVWNCPVCNRAISSHRRDELVTALAKAKDLGWKVHLVTLTVPHGMGDDLKVINDLQRDAIKMLSQGRNAISQSLKLSGQNLFGFVRAKEVTYGRNGFHPHFHLLVFTDSTTEFLKELYTSAWTKACVFSGLGRPSDLYGVDVREGNDAAEYVSKWGLEWEMTTGHTKNSRKGLTPYQLLHVYNEGGFQSEYLTVSKKQAAFLFKNFTESMKGQRQLHWSSGLRKKLGLGVELTEQEILSQRNEETELVVTVSPLAYRAIKYFNAHNGVLSMAETHPNLVNDYIQIFVDRYQVIQDKKPPRKNRSYKGK